MNLIYRRFAFSSSSILSAARLAILATSKYLRLVASLRKQVKKGTQNFAFQKQLIDAVQELLARNSLFYAPLIANLICYLYPKDFEKTECPVCCKKKWTVDYAGTKTLPARLYPGLPEFPIYARESLPLVYGRCRGCGMGKVIVAPKSFWIDAPIKPDGKYGQWMDEEAYLEEKLSHTRLHYKRMDLSKFQSPESSVIEFSPGNGIFLRTLRDEFGWKKLLGVEPDPTAAFSGEQTFQIPMINDYIYRVRNQNNFDLAVFDNSLEHHSDPEFALSIAHDCIRPGGGLFIIVPNYHSYAVETLGVDYFNMNWGHWSYFTMQSLAKLVKNAGFSVTSGYSTFFEPTVKDRIKTPPVNVDRELSGDDILLLSKNEKAFRGEFLYLLATRE